MKKDRGNEGTKPPIYRHRQQLQGRQIKSRPRSTARITHINGKVSHAGIKGAVSRKSASSPHAPHSSETGEIFPEKTA